MPLEFVGSRSDFGCGADSLAAEGVTGFGRFGLSVRGAGLKACWSCGSDGFDSFGLIGFAVPGTTGRPAGMPAGYSVTLPTDCGATTPRSPESIVPLPFLSAATAGIASRAPATAAPSTVSLRWFMTELL